MTSLKEILAVDQTPGVIEHHWKLPNGHWELEVLSDPGAAIKMESLGFDLPVSEVYSNIEVLQRLAWPYRYHSCRKTLRTCAYSGTVKGQ
jgi:hypothetical protein